MQDDVTKPVDGVEGGQCAKCLTLKPISEFKRKLSLLQSRALGYAGNYPLEVVSKYCKACQPAGTPLRSMSKRRLAELVSQGVIPQVVADNAIRSREKAGNARREYKLAKYKVQSLRDGWSFVLTPLQRELTVVMQQGKHAKMANDQFRIRYTDHYKKLLVSVREEIKTRRDLRAEGREDIADWRQLVSVEEVNALLDVWRDIPSKTRVKMKMGTLISAEWRQHVGATRVTDAMLRGRNTSAQREKVMNEILQAAREKQAEQAANMPVEDNASDLLQALGINPNKE
jgi:hypothetical protein